MSLVERRAGTKGKEGERVGDLGATCRHEESREWKARKSCPHGKEEALRQRIQLPLPRPHVYSLLLVMLTGRAGLAVLSRAWRRKG